MRTEEIARVCHEANRALQQIRGEVVNFPWENTSEAMRDSGAVGVVAALRGAAPEELHDSWCDTKRADGWTFGPVKDFAAKTHPCLLPYADLPADQRAKDAVFHAIVGALS